MFLSGSVPIVIGPPNIQEFAPAPGSILYIKELSDIDSVAKTMKYLSENPESYNQTLRQVDFISREQLKLQLFLRYN